ncbi:MAG TPA: acyltransferase [Drouetiella sp.]
MEVSTPIAEVDSASLSDGASIWQEDKSARLNQREKVSAERIKPLDGLRAVAFMSVFACHLGLIQNSTASLVRCYNEFCRWGFLGVDLFFVMSGYIITRLLLSEKVSKGRIDLKLFYYRRILRIWPVFYLALSVSALGIWLLAKRNFDCELYVSLLREVYGPLSCFWYSVPVSMEKAIALLQEQTRYPIFYSIRHLWSLCVEEQFYVFWPWCLVLARSKRQLLFFVLTTVLITEICRYSGFPNTPGFFYYSTLSRVTPLAVGALLAMGESADWKAIKFLQKYSGFCLSLAIGVIIAILSGPAHGVSLKFVSMFPWYPTFAACLGVVVFTCLHNKYAKRILSANFMQTIGRYSYCLYVFHFPILYATLPRNWTGVTNPVLRYLLWAAISFALTFLVARLSWKLIEEPVARLRFRYRP